MRIDRARSESFEALKTCCCVGPPFSALKLDLFNIKGVQFERQFCGQHFESKLSVADTYLVS